jgi:ABC-type transport system involved in multi-copper enzyme maturation permease subunit
LGQADALKSASGVATPHGLVFTSPTGIGRVAAGLMASIPGLLALLVLAGGHVAGEWSGRTLKSLLLQDGRRWRWVGGKIASLWLIGVGIEGALWAALALWTVALRRWWPPPEHLGLAHGLGLAMPDVARSLVVIAVFAAIATLAAILTHSMLGTLLGGMFVIGGSIAMSNIAFTRELPSYWLVGWMRFHAPGSGVSYALWNDKFPPGVPYPSLAVGVVGLLSLFALCVILSGMVFSRSDVTA